ncbi:GFA family protein [Pseudohongiella nitratireducens]|uniref:GFA family protein n=1 Tax=Pseudohongiella nitratireducens TaxID=1768907 RepID=UPI0027E4ED2B|nr:hypothetical protein [Pseudohongiella nitratireducens]
MTVKYTLSQKPMVDAIDVQISHKGQCHCGRVKYTVSLPDGLVDVRRCNCSMCRRRGAVLMMATLL